MRKSRLYCAFILLVGCLSAKAQTALPGIDVLHYNFSIRLNDENDTIKGQAIVTIKFVKDVSLFQLNLVKKNSKGKGMTVSAISEAGKNIAFSQDSDVVNIAAPATENSIHSFVISYKGVPADGLIISKNKYNHRTFFGDNWPNRAHNWLPCADYPGDKASVEFVVTAPDHYQVISNGLKIEEKLLPNHLRLTHWSETAQLSTKLMIIGVANFAIQKCGEVGDIPVYTYVFPEDKIAGFKSYGYALEILPFYIDKIGPFAYKKLANVQSKTKFGGMENASAIFYFENSVTTKDIEELMAHEIAHQWFGDAASETDFSNVWLSEGFATYMTNAYLESKYGPDSLKKRLAFDRTNVVNFEQSRFTPIVDYSAKGDYLSLLNYNSYQKGSWVLHMLRRKLGEENFWKGMRNYYTEFNGGNANTDSLRKVMERASGQDLNQFFFQWVYSAGHPQLNITWKYGANGVVTLNIVQKQLTLFDFPLEVLINDKMYSVNVKEKNTKVDFPVSERPFGIKIDPEVNLLATFKLTESE